MRLTLVHCSTSIKPSMSTIQKKKSTYRRTRPWHHMVDGDLDLAEAVTHTQYAEIQPDGTTIIKQFLQSLDSVPIGVPDRPMRIETPWPVDNFNDDQMQDLNDSPPLKRCAKV